MTEQVNAQQIAKWRAEIAAWPPALRRVAERFPPWAFVQIASTGAVGRVHGFGEGVDGQVRVDVIVRRQWNPQRTFKRNKDELVTGLDSTDLEMVQ